MKRYMIPGGETAKAVEGNTQFLFTVTAKDSVLGMFIGVGHSLKRVLPEDGKTLKGHVAEEVDAEIVGDGLEEKGSKGRNVGVIVNVGLRGISGLCAENTLEQAEDVGALEIGRAKLGDAVLRNEVIGELPIKIKRVMENIFIFEYEGELVHGMSGSPIIQGGKLIGAHWGRSEKKQGEAVAVHVEDMASELLMGRPEREIVEVEDGGKK